MAETLRRRLLAKPTAAVVGWDFGDGTTLADGSATANHSYASPGTYVVTVTVTDGQDEWVISSAISLNG